MLSINQTPTPNGQMVMDAITFAGRRSEVYVPVKEVGFALSLPMDSKGQEFFLNGNPVEIARTLYDGTRLVKLHDLRACDIDVHFDDMTKETTIGKNGVNLIVRVGGKRVVINKAEQRLKAIQGNRIVFETHVSTGRKHHGTPNGHFTAGPEKTPMRHSKKYDDAPMPWSVQVAGDIFMHGYPSVPKYPASHGCIRIPLRPRNPALWLYNWIDLGTPITIGNDWDDDQSSKLSSCPPSPSTAISVTKK